MPVRLFRALCMVVLVACQPAMEPVGLSTILPSELRYTETSDAGEPGVLPSDASQGRRPSPLPPDFRQTYRKLNRARFSSRGHSYERFMADVFVSPTVSSTSGGMSLSPVSVGTQIAMDHYELVTGGERHAGTLIMRKEPPGFDSEGSDWRYIVVGRTGYIEQEGRLEACRGCHRDAPSGALFSPQLSP